jgi:hypothetical protein
MLAAWIKKRRLGAGLRIDANRFVYFGQIAGRASQGAVGWIVGAALRRRDNMFEMVAVAANTLGRNLDAESSRRRLGKSGSSWGYQVPALTGQSARVLQREGLGFSDEGLQLALLRLGQSSVIVLGHEKVKTGLLPGGKASQPLFGRLKGDQLRKRHSTHLANDSGNAQIQAFHGLPVIAQPVEALEIDMNALALNSLQEPGYRQSLVGQNLPEMGIGL